MKILDSIPVRLDTEQVLARMKLHKKSSHVEEMIRELIDIVLPVAKPKVVYEVCYVENKDKDSVDIAGVKFTSRLLRDNLDKVGRVFPYVATCGREADEIHVPSHEFIKGFYLDQIKEMLLESAIHYLEDHLTRKYQLGQISKMQPGSLESWPIHQQKPLFSIFGDVERLIGVRLTDSFLMIPLKSVSGIYFPTEIKFESCQLCRRARCSGRKAPYNPELAQKYAER